MAHDQTEPNKSNDRRKAQALPAQPETKGSQSERAPRERRNQDRPFKKNREGRNEESIYISVVIPLLNEEGSLPELAERLEAQLREVANSSWEVLFIDDGSTDASFTVIRELHNRNPRFKAVRFRRNYGKSAALSVGFAQARGKYVITMDADLQDDPAEIPALLNKLKSGYDLVSGWKKKRYDPISKTLPSKFFNWVTSKASGIKLHDFNCGLKGYRREVVKSLQVYGEMHRYLPALAHWDGFKVTEIPVQHHPRIHGYSKFGVSRFLKGFLDLLTVLFTTRYVKRPLHFFGALGSLFALIGFGIDLYLTIEWALGHTNLSNRPLAIFGIGLIIVGVQLISIGLIAELIAKNSMQNFKYNIQERL
ncbi:MAG TPA: glycosyltransferase family 2 protein [Patescibacteria group bacterium]|nr:glycosyltransferase family 2 protein [Patescibacteria group bacterium]